MKSNPVATLGHSSWNSAQNYIWLCLKSYFIKRNPAATRANTKATTSRTVIVGEAGLTSGTQLKQKRLNFSWLSTNVLEVLWGQPIKLVQVASSSELHENQQNDLVFFEIIHSHFCRVSEVQKIWLLQKLIYKVWTKNFN